MKAEQRKIEYSNEAEIELISRIARGDTDAFTEIVLLHQDLVYAMIMRQVGDKTVASELAQETFIRAYKGLHQFKQKSKFSSWLTRIALNVCHTHFSSRNYKNNLLTIPISSVAEMPASGSNMDQEVIHQRLRIAVSQLKKKYRDVITLHTFEGRSYSEISEILKIPTGTVASRINYAVNVLRQDLKRFGYGN
jgi:RNA polymerase sigma-70 factor (ECF subfamily)